MSRHKSFRKAKCKKDVYWECRLLEIQDHLQKMHYSRLECMQFVKHLEHAQLSNIIMQELRAVCSAK